MIKLYSKINCGLCPAMHGIYFGYLTSLFFRFWLFLSCESPEICCVDRREAEFQVPRQQVSIFLQLLKIDRGRLAKASSKICRNSRLMHCLHTVVDLDPLNLL